MSARDWHVLVVAGASGVGKTSACAELLRRHEIGSVEVDDLYAAVVALTTPFEQPVLHALKTADRRPEHVVDLLRGVAQALAPAVSAVIGTHLEEGPPVVIEGDFLVPASLRAAVDAGAGQVRAVVVHEPDADQLQHNMTTRSGAAPPRTRAMVSAAYGGWLAGEARRHRIPVVEARPWDTLADRIEAAARRTR